MDSSIRVRVTSGTYKNRRDEKLDRLTPCFQPHSPFCPDQQHRYPRPDNLQRHVRVHHEDKSRDDQQLRAVLAQRPEGGPRGRRRRTAV